MKKLWNKIWNSEPVIFVGSLTTAWAGVVTFDKGSDEFNIDFRVYVIMVVVTIFLTAITRSKVEVYNPDSESSE